MRILLCLNRDLMSNLALNLLAPALDGHVFDIVLSSGIGKNTAPKASEIEHWGKLEQGLIEGGLFPLLEKKPPASAPFQTFEQHARNSESARLLTFASINTGEGLAYVRRFAPDIVVSIRFGQIFKAPLIALPRLGILNLHSGLLPDYRGVLATFWAMLHDEPAIGCTLHKVTDGTIDTGEIVAMHALPPDRRRSLLWNIASLYTGGTAMIATALEKLERDEPIPTTPQDSRKGRYFTYPDEAAAARFLAKGLCFYSADDYAEIFAQYGIIGPEAALLLSQIRH
jgi:methionyl-tRNA formyltransferase